MQRDWHGHQPGNKKNRVKVGTLVRNQEHLYFGYDSRSATAPELRTFSRMNSNEGTPGKFPLKSRLDLKEKQLNPHLDRPVYGSSSSCVDFIAKFSRSSGGPQIRLQGRCCRASAASNHWRISCRMGCSTGYAVAPIHCTPPTA